MKKLITIILILFAVSCNAQDTVKSYTKIINYGKPSRETWKCFVIKNGNKIDTVCEIKTWGYGQAKAVSAEELYDGILDTVYESKNCYKQGQAHKDIDTTLVTLKTKIETDYKNDLKQLQELQTKIIKEESYLEILNYLIEERKK